MTRRWIRFDSFSDVSLSDDRRGRLLGGKKALSCTQPKNIE